MEIRRVHPYFWRTRARDPTRWEISMEVCEWVVEHRTEGEFFHQSDGRWQITVRVPDLGYRVRVILLGDAETLFNAFRDQPIGRRSDTR